MEKQCNACKKAAKNKERGIAMVGPLAYDVPDKCKLHLTTPSQGDKTEMR